MRNSKLIPGSIFSLILLLFTSCGSGSEEEPAKIRPVKYGKVMMSGDALSGTFSGTAQSDKETQLSFKVGGTLTLLNVNVGDKVRKGQLIAKVDQTDYSIQYQQSLANMKSVETQIQSAKSQMINSKAIYDRVEKLYENNSVSISEFEQAKSGYEVARSAYEAALAQANASGKQVESAQNQVNYAQLTAPFPGVITAVFVEENELVNSGTPIVVISAVGNPEISVGIPEIFIARITKDQTVDITFSSIPGRSFVGTVYEVGYSSLGGSTYPVTVKIDEPTEEIRPGMVADVRFNFAVEGSDGSQKLVVPVAAVGENDNGNFVFSLEKQGDQYLVKRKTVQIGELTPAGFEVVSGLSKEELVATAGLNSLLDGIQVRLLND